MWSVAVGQDRLSKHDICSQYAFRGHTTLSFLRASKVMATDYHISKSWKIPHNLVIEALPRQGLITGYNPLSATSDLKMADYDIPAYPGTLRYNPQVKDHGIIIGCLIFHGLLMHMGEGDRIFCSRKNSVEVFPQPDHFMFCTHGMRLSLSLLFTLGRSARRSPE